VNDLLTTDEAAELLRSNTNTLAYWRATDQGPTWAKIGRRVLYRRTDVDSFVASKFAAVV
jgi:hypothetical protein